MITLNHIGMSDCKFRKEMLLPRITRVNDADLESFVVTQINEEISKLKDGECPDFIQMQFFYQSVFENKDKLKEIMSVINKKQRK